MKVVLDKSEVAFFKQTLLDDTESQIRLLERTRNIEGKLEFGRVRLYEERSSIERHFNRSSEDKGLLLRTDPSFGLILKVKTSIQSSVLTWKETEGYRHTVMGLVRDDLPWENGEPPKARLTEGGKITKKVEIL